MSESDTAAGPVRSLGRWGGGLDYDIGAGKVFLHKVVKKPRLDTTQHISPPDDFDEKNPFTEGNVEDEIKLLFDEGKSLFVSKSFLSYSSPVFARMFQSSFKEKDDKVVELSGKSYEAFLEMLLLLHPRIQKKGPEIAARIVYQIAHEYRIPPVLEKAEAALLRIIRSGVGKWEPYYSVSQMLQYNGTFLKNLFELLEFSLTYNNGTLLDAVAERISVFPMEVFIEHSSYKDLPESTKNKILMCRLRRCDKNKVFK